MTGMKNLITLAIILFSFSSYAQKAKLTIVDRDIDRSQLSDQFDVNYPDQQEYALPDREERDLAYKGVKAITKWDELRKDIFFMDLRSKSIKELLSRYPELSEAEIKTLKARVK